MADNRPEIVLDGDITPLRQKLREAGAEFKRFGAEGEQALGRMTGPLGALQSKFIAIGAVLAGGKVFAAAVDESKRLTEEATALGKAMGMSTTEASILNVALGDIGVGADEFIGSAQHLSRQLRTNEESLNAMGLRTREANGEYRNMKDIMFDAVEVLKGYKEGTDRNLAAQVLFAKGAGDVVNLLKLQKDAMQGASEKARELGLIIGEQNVEATREYKAAMNDAGDVMSAFKSVIGNAIMPVLTTLANWFAAIGPAAVVVLKGAIGGLVAVFHGLLNGVVVVWETINAFVFSAAEPIMALSQAIALGVQGKFAEAGERLKAVPANVAGAWSGAMDTIAAKSEDTSKKLHALFGAPDATGPANKGGKGFTPPPKTDGAADEKSFMAYYETELAARKNAYEQGDAARRFSKEQELAYWRDLQQTVELTNKDRVTIAKRTATLELEVRRQLLQQQRALELVDIEGRRNAALQEVDSENQAAQHLFANGQINKQQLLEIEQQYLQRRFEIEYQAQLERMELAAKDPTASPAERERLYEQLLELERRFKMQSREIGQAQREVLNADMMGFTAGIGDAFGRTVDQMLVHGARLRQTMTGLLQGVYQAFVTNMVTKPLADWVTGLARQLAAKLNFLSTEKGLEASAATQTVGIKASETGAVVAANAAQAGSGAAASQAGIPIVGPMLAVAAMAAVFAAVMAMNKRKSAAGGYDIPKGLNPMTQLHEEEMVLPQKYANVIRRLEGQGEGGGQGGGTTNVFNINALDAHSVRKLIKREGSAIADSLALQRRNFKL
jgi:hypothetical protein